ncbi:glycosyltransferase [Pseudarthrobacter sp. 1G09]|uniref:glycosyltransferase n=1 Tax=Pseudarthrobacter sp. 1G09 TaxID=3416178 RepID=UPI003CEE64E5
MKFAVVTPVRNAGSLVSETINSILSQDGLSTGKFELDYLVWDGESDDNTADHARSATRGSARVITGSDKSMYDGLAQAFRLVDGDIYFYLNAGDLLLPGALSLVAQLFEDKGLDWISGMNVHYAVNGTVVRANLPLRYRKSWIRQGIYGRVLPPVQQESTFWSKALMSKLDLDELASYRLAGDYFIWHSFSKYTEPTIVQAALGGFRYHGVHLSADMLGYRKEMERVARPLSFFDKFKTAAESVAWHGPLRLKSMLNPSILRYDPARDDWL